MDATSRKSRWVYLLQGIVTVLFGIATLTWPGITFFTLVLLFGAFAVVVGFTQLATSLTNRQEPGWWLGLITGLVSVAAGIGAFIWPGMTALVLLYIIGAHALFAGLVALWQAVRSWRSVARMLLSLLRSIAAIAFAILAFAWPGATALTLTWLIGVYALVFGVAEIISSFVVKGAERRR